MKNREKPCSGPYPDRRQEKNYLLRNRSIDLTMYKRKGGRPKLSCLTMRGGGKGVETTRKNWSEKREKRSNQPQQGTTAAISLPGPGEPPKKRGTSPPRKIGEDRRKNLKETAGREEGKRRANTSCIPEYGDWTQLT